ncbi:flagellar biosynthesis protein FlhB [Pseudaminobacter soli (ex Li et al. 2025)]|uniref:Flagellar biosynthetic protein FlhB n=1 Tax=Pseudaminobacter soli (ex Li et al. 2025) TaxID=1295366 RepID=A0A2P7SE86_9HYPH|nr:flagellar biosynthesis protein FlhB [Mesorhizobium soli]PSJ60675.1 flagellar biosynthesis protein FlhB [Mesorhizobium soli]
MSEGADKESKTEEATEKKVRDTIEKGKLPVSKEISIFASFIAILVFATFFAQGNITQLGWFLGIFLEKPEAWPLANAQDVIELYRVVFLQIAKLLGTMMVLLVVAGVAASVLQNMPQFVAERIRPQASRISLAKGWSRMFGVQGFVEFLKSLGKLGFVVLVLIFTLKGEYRDLLAGMITHPTAFVLTVRSILIHILVSIVVVMGVIATADLVWSRFHWRQELKMTKQEVKDELKQSEGDPIIKSRLRSLGRDRARRRMMAAVPKATLVIANPTHYSIALKYVRDEDQAPVVLAKGQDLVALKIREIAEEHNIPIFEDVALARSMYKQVSVDNVIPTKFYQAVAELIRIVYSNKARKVVS